MRIGLLGGSFNPAHYGHLYISLQAKKYLQLKQIWWLPNKQNPLKKNKNSDFNHRYQQCLELTSGQPNIFIKDYEKKLSSNYSIDILKRIIRKYPQHQFFWIIGADNMVKFHLWHKWQEIINLVPIIILDRNNDFNKALISKAASYCRRLSEAQGEKKSYFLKIKKCPLSSSAIL